MTLLIGPREPKCDRQSWGRAAIYYGSSLPWGRRTISNRAVSQISHNANAQTKNENVEICDSSARRRLGRRLVLVSAGGGLLPTVVPTKRFPRSTIHRHRSLNRVPFTAARTQPKEPQRSIAPRMAVEFFGSRTSRHQTALTFTLTWWPLKTPGTTKVC